MYEVAYWGLATHKRECCKEDFGVHIRYAITEQHPETDKGCVGNIAVS